jgi:CheY-like chemotaxis protein
LVVDDDVDIRESLVELLQGEGYLAVGAANGAEALDLLRRQRSSVILLDLMMPVMDGFQFRREQLGDPALSDIPVVLVSAGGGGEQAALQLGVLGCVKKPLDVPQLLRMIRLACEAAAAS